VKCKLIAEVGLSHEGSLGLAKAFIDASKQAGADAVKFQMHNSDYESSKHEKFRINFSDQDSSRRDYWLRTSFTSREWKLLKSYADSQDIEFIVSVFSAVSLEIARDLGIEKFKLGSGDLNNEEFLTVIPQLDISLIISTGMAFWNEIEQAVSTYRNLPSLVVLQCTSKYPTPLNQVGLNIMTEIKRRFDIPTGLSDHTNSISSSVFAISAGADYIEKHVIFDKMMFGPDVTSSITFEQLSQLSRFSRDFEFLQEPLDKDQMAEELHEMRQLFGRSLALKENRPAGYLIESASEFCLRKPGGGLPWKSIDQFIGQRLKRDYNREEFLTNEHVDFS
jgi:N,N'-diacetyllegionaminate synthase